MTSISESLHEFSCFIYATRVFLTSFTQSVKAGSVIQSSHPKTATRERAPLSSVHHSLRWSSHSQQCAFLGLGKHGWKLKSRFSVLTLFMMEDLVSLSHTCSRQDSLMSFRLHSSTDWISLDINNHLRVHSNEMLVNTVVKASGNRSSSLVQNNKTFFYSLG